MKIATGFTEKFYSEFKKEHNEVVKDKYLLSDSFGKEVREHSFEAQLVDSLDSDEANPIFSFEISKNETKSGAPHDITFEGSDFFTWKEV